MNPEESLRRNFEQGRRVYVRGFDPEKDEWNFEPDDASGQQIVATLDRSNPRRGEIHKILLEVLDGRNPHREGLRMKFGLLPTPKKPGDEPTGGRVQIIDVGESELSPIGRKVVKEGVVVGEWTRELNRAVEGYGDAQLLTAGVEGIEKLRGDRKEGERVYQAKAIDGAQALLAELGLTDKYYVAEQLQRFAPRTLADALACFEQRAEGKDAVAQVRYDPMRPFQTQCGRWPATDIEKGQSKDSPAARGRVDAAISAALNYSVQRALLDYLVEKIGVSGADDKPALAAYEQKLCDAGILLYTHPGRSEKDYQRASREAARQMGSAVLGCFASFHGAKTPATPENAQSKGDGSAQGFDKLHAEIVGTLGDSPTFKETAPLSEREGAYCAAAKSHFARYAQRELQRVGIEQTKAVPQKRPENRFPAKNKDEQPAEAGPDEPSKPKSKLVQDAAKGAAQVAAQTLKGAGEAETMSFF